MTTSKPSTCTAPVPGGCDREVYAKGLCRSHYQRGLRGAALEKPVREGAMVALQSVRVPEEVAQALAAEASERGADLAEVMREALEEWAARRAKKGARARK